MDNPSPHTQQDKHHGLYYGHMYQLFIAGHTCAILFTCFLFPFPDLFITYAIPTIFMHFCFVVLSSLTHDNYTFIQCLFPLPKQME
jgi:hypothetical protein